RRGEGGERSEPGEGRSVVQLKLLEPLTPTLSPSGRGGARAAEVALMYSPAPAAPIRPIAFADANVVREPRAGGEMVLRATAPLQPCEPSLARLFRAAVAAAPDRTFLAERAPDGGWRKLTYAGARQTVDALAQALLERGLDAERPVMILSGNAI